MGMETAARASADVGLIGLAVMGQNLALNMADHGYRVAVYNRTRFRDDGFGETGQFGFQRRGFVAL